MTPCFKSSTGLHYVFLMPIKPTLCLPLSLPRFPSHTGFLQCHEHAQSIPAPQTVHSLWPSPSPGMAYSFSSFRSLHKWHFPGETHSILPKLAFPSTQSLSSLANVLIALTSTPNHIIWVTFYWCPKCELHQKEVTYLTHLSVPGWYTDLLKI